MLYLFSLKSTTERGKMQQLFRLRSTALMGVPHMSGPGLKETLEHMSSTAAILGHFAAPSPAPSNDHYHRPDTNCSRLIWISKQD